MEKRRESHSLAECIFIGLSLSEEFNKALFSIRSAQGMERLVIIHAGGKKSAFPVGEGHVLHAAPGEILGFAGLMGAGRTEMARLICGADKRDGGEIFVYCQKVDIRDPSGAVKAGIGYL